VNRTGTIPLDHLEGIGLRIDLDTHGLQRVLITGGTGFVGTWLLAALSVWAKEREQQVEVNVLVRRRGARLSDFLRANTFLKVNYLKVQELEFEHARVPFTAVAHLSGFVGGSRNEDVLATLEADTLIMMRIAEMILRNQRTCRPPARLLLTSSGAVYGPKFQTNLPIREIDELVLVGSPSNRAYSVGKAASELIAESLVHENQAQLTIARLFSFIGPLLPLSGHFAVGNFLRDAILEPEIRVNGDGSAIRSWMDAADMGESLLKLWLGISDSFTIVNVGAGKAMSILEAARAIGEISGKDVLVLNQQTPNGHLRSYYVPEISRLESKVDISRHKSFREAAEDCFNWLKRQES
jgi:nucleoside-diphosphate-sugar epimerase